VRGFAIGLQASDGLGWVIERCDFSDNYTDPEFGWGEGPRYGGLILTRLRGCVLRGNTARRVWNGLDLSECANNLITGNRCSHCTNVCLRMDRSPHNTILDNDLSYGLRIKPGEVHARDSAGVLIESGSDHNLFYRNDIPHGGDGVFVRALNEYVSAGNVFIENDCSHAHNNGFEAWTPAEVYIRNRANHCSFGFWLGGSDRTVLLGNEAAHNGARGGQANAPAPEFGHAGIIAFGGSSSHTLADGNHCHHNGGGGLVFAGDTRDPHPAWRAYHWVVQGNRLEENRWGRWIKRATHVDVLDNDLRGNEHTDHHDDVVSLRTTGAAETATAAPCARLLAPPRARVGEPVVFDAGASHDPLDRPLTFAWTIDGKPADGPRVTHTFDRPGYQRVALTVSNGVRAALAWADLYVVAALAADGAVATDWTWRLADAAGGPGLLHAAPADGALHGVRCVQVRAARTGGFTLTGRLPLTGARAATLAAGGTLRLWLRVLNPNVNECKLANPTVVLHTPGGTATYTPQAPDGKPLNWLLRSAFSEARWGWRPLEIPLAGDATWRRVDDGQPALAAATALELTVCEPGGEPVTYWLDGPHGA